jgi:hypothetical protein
MLVPSIIPGFDYNNIADFGTDTRKLGKIYRDRSDLKASIVDLLSDQYNDPFDEAVSTLSPLLGD